MKLMLMTMTTQRHRCIAASGRSSFPAGFVSYPKLQQKNEDKVEDEDDHHDENHHGDDHDDLE